MLMRFYFIFYRQLIKPGALEQISRPPPNVSSDASLFTFIFSSFAGNLVICDPCPFEIVLEQVLYLLLSLMSVVQGYPSQGWQKPCFYCFFSQDFTYLKKMKIMKLLFFTIYQYILTFYHVFN